MKTIKQMFAFSEHLCYNEFEKEISAIIMRIQKNEKRMTNETDYPYSAENI